MGRILVGVLIGYFLSSMTLNIWTDECTSLDEKLDRQRRKMDARYKDRPIARKKYEQRAILIAALVLVYGVLSVICIIKVIGDWQT